MALILLQNTFPRNARRRSRSFLSHGNLLSSEVAFVGGINLNNGSVVSPGHAPRESGSTHDVYVELRGPAATDVHHNFVQRWNEASDRDLADTVLSLHEVPGVLSASMVYHHYLDESH